MNIAQFEATVQGIVGEKYYAVNRTDYRKRGKRIVSWSVYSEKSGWVGVTACGVANNPNDVLDELRKILGVRDVA